MNQVEQYLLHAATTRVDPHRVPNRRCAKGNFMNHIVPETSPGGGTPALALSGLCLLPPHPAAILALRSGRVLALRSSAWRRAPLVAARQYCAPATMATESTLACGGRKVTCKIVSDTM